ncbi:hypothetical protein [Ponticaulis profundi]|uniref:Uncharacterized protein n=1 Tax=Ponticaulis profundi TaxID=2665222 RepID=A0ABW1S4H1_9PROT
MTNVLVLGDSHLGAIKRAHNEVREENKWLSFMALGKGTFATSPFFEVDEQGKTVRITAEEWNKVEFSSSSTGKAKWPDLLVVSLPINTSRILRDFSWETHVPWRLKETSKEITLSDAFVEKLIAQDNQYAIDYTTALVKIGMQVAALEAPRFFEDAPYLKTSRLNVISHIDALYRERTIQTLSSRGVGVIRQAKDTISETGTTKMAFNNERPNDVHHANLEYGHICISEIRKYAGID